MCTWPKFLITGRGKTGELAFNRSVGKIPFLAVQTYLLHSLPKMHTHSTAPGKENMAGVKTGYFTGQQHAAAVARMNAQ